MITNKQFIAWITKRCVKRLSTKTDFVVKVDGREYNYNVYFDTVTVTKMTVLDDEEHPLGWYRVVVKTYDLNNWSIIDNKMVADHDVMPL